MTFLSKKQNTLWAQASANCFLYNIEHAEHTDKNSLQSHEKVSLARKRPFLWYSLVPGGPLEEIHGIADY